MLLTFTTFEAESISNSKTSYCGSLRSQECHGVSSQIKYIRDLFAEHEEHEALCLL